MSKTIFITGGAGYVGSSLTKYSLEQGYTVVVFDNLSFGDEGLAPVMKHPNFQLIKGDITRPAEIQKALERASFDAVIHLAAIVGDPACAKQPQLARAINWEASVKLLEYVRERRIKRFIFASTCSNYGKMADPNGYVDENSPLTPVSLYAELKVKFEKHLLDETKAGGGFCPTALRFATVYGLSPRMRFDLTVNEFVKELALGRELQIFGEQFWRPYCHVQDFARAIELVLESAPEKIAHKVFNVGDTKENYQKKMIVEEIRKVIPDAKVKYVHKTEDPRDYRVAFTKIQNELGFKISKRVPDGIREIKEAIDKGAYADPDDAKYSNVLSIRNDHDPAVRT